MRSIKIDNYSGGMITAIDPLKLPYGAGQLAVNVDTERKPGSLCKCWGIKSATLGGLWPVPNYESVRILSKGRLVYNQVWDGSTKVNRLRELIVIQVENLPSGLDHGLDWFEFEHTVGDTDWIIPLAAQQPFFCDHIAGSSDAWQGAYGYTRAGKVRWLEHAGVLRGACGAFICNDESSSFNNMSDSFPIQWRYVNRLPDADTDPTQNLGFFQCYDYSNANFGKCLWGFGKINRGRSLPNYNPESVFSIATNSYNNDVPYFYSHDNIGFLSSVQLQYSLLPVYDGHQISPSKFESKKIYYPAYVDNFVGAVTKFYIEIPETSSGGYTIPERLTGYNLYRSHANLGLISDISPVSGETVNYGSYQIAQNIDSRIGIENIFNRRAQYLETGNAAHIEFYISFINDNAYWNGARSLYKDLFIAYNDGTNDREYPITDSSVYWYAGTPAGMRMSIYFGSVGNTGLTAGLEYEFAIHSRWYDTGSDTVKIAILDVNANLGEAPPYLLPDRALSEQPIVECNYGGAAIFKDRMLVYDVAHNDELKPDTLRYSYPVNSAFAGFDIQPFELIPPNIKKDNRIVGAFNYLDYAIILTEKMPFYKYLVEDSGIEQVIELLWDFGLESIDSVKEHNGLLYFWGNRGDVKTICVWNPARNIVDAGKFIRPDLDAVLAQEGVRSDLTKGVILPHENKYLICIPRYANA